MSLFLPPSKLGFFGGGTVEPRASCMPGNSTMELHGTWKCFKRLCILLKEKSNSGFDVIQCFKDKKQMNALTPGIERCCVCYGWWTLSPQSLIHSWVGLFGAAKI